MNTIFDHHHLRTQIPFLIYNYKTLLGCFVGYINVGCGGKAGYYFSSTCVLVGSFTLFFIDLHRRNLSRHKHTRANGTKHICASDSCPQRRRPSFSQEPDNEGAHVAAAGTAGATAAALVLRADIAPAQGITYLRRMYTLLIILISSFVIFSLYLFYAFTIARWKIRTERKSFYSWLCWFDIK